MTKSFLILAIIAAMLAGCSISNPGGPATSISPTPGANELAAADTDNADDLDDLDELEDELDVQTKPVYDPIEKWNRGVFKFNDALYVWVAKPVVDGYKAVVPEPGRVGVSNVFDNLAMPVRGVNCLLQGKGKAAGTELNRFLINTTVGILGVRDAANDDYEIAPPPPEDFGQTLAVWGLGDGCYLVWPLLGPSTVRDSGGMVGDYFLDPVTYIPPWAVRLGVSGVRGVNSASFSLKEYDTIRTEAVDPYAAVRDGYRQYRDGQIEK